MAANEPIRHHYIPQFILRNFSPDHRSLNYYDKEKRCVEKQDAQNTFMERNLYRDEINHAADPTKIEHDLSCLESDAAKIINSQFLTGNGIHLTKQEDELLKLFFAVMGFRSEHVMEFFKKGLSASGKNFYSHYQNDRDFEDLWKRNLGNIVSCRSMQQIIDHPEIDDPFKEFMYRDIFGFGGKYIAVLDRAEYEEFILSDTYPVVSFGIKGDDIKESPRVELYARNPISPDRIILVAGNGVEEASPEVLGLRSCVLYRPTVKEDGSIRIRVKKLEKQEVESINRALFEEAKKGFIFRNMPKSIEREL